jgi:hypothetical protein
MLANQLSPKRKPHNLRGKAVQRREATRLLREILSFPEVIPFTCVYLKPRNLSRGVLCDDFELHVKAERDRLTRQVIERLAFKQGLVVRDEPGGFLVISAPREGLLEVTA